MVRSTLEEWTARENGDRGTLLRVRAMNHMAMAATTVATPAPRARPTSSPRYPRSTIANPRRQPLRAARARITSRRTSIVCRWKGIAVPAAEGVRLILIGWRTKHGVLHQA